VFEKEFTLAVTLQHFTNHDVKHINYYYY